MASSSIVLSWLIDAKPQVSTENDAIVAFIHFFLKANGFKCLGIGDSFSKTEETSSSQSIPAGWNNSGEVYSLRYSNSSQESSVFIVKALVLGNSLLVHAASSKDENQIFDIEVKPLDFINPHKDFTNLESLFDASKMEQFGKTLQSRIVDQLLSKIEAKIRNESPSSPPNPLRVTKPVRDVKPQEHYNPSFTGVGHEDLYPTGSPLGPFYTGPGFGGGSVVGPDHPGFGNTFPGRPGVPPGLPPGAVPPGARFDPYGPGSHFGEPDPDHLPPPGRGNYDNMFF